MYQYKVYTLDKQIIEGTIDAASEDLAEARLREAGYAHVLTLKKSSQPLSLQKLFPTPFSVQKSDIIDFFGQLATLIDSRVPFVQALWILSEQSKKISFKEVINRLGRQVSSGIPFSQALAYYPKLVPGQYCQVIAVSEKSGDLPRGLRLVAGYMENELKTTGNVRRMLAYPAFLGVMAFTVAVVLATIALPAMVKLFNAMHVQLPPMTRFLMSSANILLDYKYQIIAGLIALVLFIIWLWKTPPVRKFMDGIFLKIPVINSIIIMRNICRFCRTGSMLVDAGMMLPQALNSIIGIIDHDVIKKCFTALRQEIIKGKSLSREMMKHKIFPRLLVDVVAIGEKTGTLKDSFSSMADYYEKRLDQRVKKLLGLIEPASIIIAGIVIGFIGIAMLQPLYSIYQNFR